MNRLQMDDVGKRIDHLQDLKDLWEEGLSVLDRRDPRYRTPKDDSDIATLRSALDLLNAHMLSDLHEIDVLRLRNEINSITKESR
jgi:hypothetical protein